MSEKKCVGKNVPIALGIVCIVLAVLLVGSIKHYTSTINDKDATIANLKDQISNLNTELSSLKRDLNSPVIRIISPANGSIVTKITPVSGIYYDRNDDVVKVEFRIDHSDWKPVSFSNNIWNFSFDPLNLTNGLHTLEVLIVDKTNLFDRQTLILNVSISHIARLLPDVLNYPKLEAVFMRLYPSEWLLWKDTRENTVNCMKIMLKMYSGNPKLQLLPEDVLQYAVSCFSEGNTCTFMYNATFFNETIIPIANSLKGHDDLDTAINIYKWVNDYIIINKHVHDIDLNLRPFDIRDIYKTRAGLCYERSVLMTALLRAAGVPARRVSSDIQIYHGWVEIYYNDSWIPIDSTGYLDFNRDGLVDMRERIAEDVVIRDTTWYKYAGYKYSVRGAECILALSRYDEWKNEALKAITLFKRASNWKERDELGRLALKYAVMSVIGEEKEIYVMRAQGVKNDSIVIIFESFPLLYYEPAPFSNLPPLLHMIGEGMTLNLIVTDLHNVSLFLPADKLKELRNIVSNRLTLINEIRTNFATTLLNIQHGIINETYFTLPDLNDTYLYGHGRILPQGYTYKPAVESIINFEKLSIRIIIPSIYEEFTYIKFIDEKGNQLLELTEDGYFKKCPSTLKIPFPQILHIKKEGNYIIVQIERL